MIVTSNASTDAATEPQVWSAHTVRSLGLTTDVETAGAILGIGRTKAYELAKSNRFPAKVIRIGRRYVVSTSTILTLLDA